MNVDRFSVSLRRLIFAAALVLTSGLAAQPASGLTQPTAAVAPAAVSPDTFSFSAEDLPIKQALALFARANRLNIVPDLDVDGTVTVDFHGLPLNLAMQALLEANGYYFTEEGRLLRVRNRETRLFHIDYIHAVRAGQGSNAVQISSGGSGGGSSGGGGGGSGASAGGGAGAGQSSGNEGSSMTVTNTSTIDFWGSLGEQLKTMMTEKGSFTINSLAGTVLVRDSHRNVEVVAQYLKEVEANVGRQIELEVEIYEVALNNATQLGINWQRVSEHIDTTFAAMPERLALPAGSGLIVQTPIYGPAPAQPGIRVGHQRGNTQAVLDALKQEGELKVVSKPRLRTLNNQPAVVRVGQDLPVFSRQVTQSPGSPPVITETETIQSVTVGTVLSIIPQVSGNGLITLDVTPAVSRLVRTAVSATGNTSAPVIDIRQASSIVRVRDGATVVLGGLVQDSTSVTRRKVPVLGDIPFLGKAFTGSYDNKERTELVFVLTPRVIHDGHAGNPAAVPSRVSLTLPPAQP